MGKTEQNLTSTERFIREVLEKHFKQKVDPETLREAAKKLCEALPERRREAA